MNFLLYDVYILEVGLVSGVRTPDENIVNFLLRRLLDCLVWECSFAPYWEWKQEVSNDCFTCHLQYSLVPCGITLLQQNQK